MTRNIWRSLGGPHARLQVVSPGPIWSTLSRMDQAGDIPFSQNGVAQLCRTA